MAKRPKTYYDIGPIREEVLLWQYSKTDKYQEAKGKRHRFSFSEESGDVEEFLAGGRIHEGRASIVFNTSDIRIQRIIYTEVRQRHPDVEIWLSHGYGLLKTPAEFFGEDA